MLCAAQWFASSVMLAEQRERGTVGCVGAVVLKRSVRVLLLNTTGGRVSEDLLSPLITPHLWGSVAEGHELAGQGVECRDQQTPLPAQGARRADEKPQRLFDVAFFVPNDSSLMSLPTSSLAAIADACITSGVGDGGVASSQQTSSHDYAWQLELLNQWVKLDAQYVGCTTATTGGTHVSRPCQVCAGAVHLAVGWHELCLVA